MTQNELIGVTGINTIQSELIEEIARAKCFPVTADKVTTYIKEMLLICFCYVDQNEVIRVVLEFLELERITGS